MVFAPTLIRAESLPMLMIRAEGDDAELRADLFPILGYTVEQQAARPAWLHFLGRGN